LCFKRENWSFQLYYQLNKNTMNKNFIRISIFIGIVISVIYGISYLSHSSSPTVLGAVGVGWNATTPTSGTVSPNRINGVEQAVKASYLTATSTTATSTITSRFLVGTTTESSRQFNMNVWGSYGTNGSDLLTIQDNKSQAGALYFDGSNTSARIYHPLDATYLASTSDLTVFARIMVPTSNPVTNYAGIFSVCDSTTTCNRSRSFVIDITTSGYLVVYQFGQTYSTDWRYATVATNNLVTNYGGKIIDLVVVKDSVNNALRIEINGIPQAFTTTTAGTDPTWKSAVNSVYALVGLGDGASTIYTSRIYQAHLFNRALSHDDIIKLRERNVAWADLGGSFLPKINSSFYLGSTIINGDFETYAAGVFTGWATTTAGTSAVTQETTIVHSGSSALKFVVDASNSSVLIKDSTAVITANKKYRVTYWARGAVGGETVAIGSDGSGQTTICSQALTATYAQYICEMTPTVGTVLNIKRNGSASETFYLDDVKLEEIGEVLNSNLEHADPAKSTVVMDLSSNSYTGTVTATGIVQIKPIYQIGNLFFNSTGKIGIGTTTPAVPLDIQGSYRGSVTSTSTGYICSATLEGAIIYNLSNHYLWLCKGSEPWTKMF
jgi:hypothetical protein